MYEDCKKIREDYWDGSRRYGYGGYKYMPGRWSSVAKKIIKTYNLKSGSSILDVGCGKGFLLYEIKLLILGIKIYGFDISKHALRNAKYEIKKNLFSHKAQNRFPFKNKKFDLVFSLMTLHNLKIFDLKKALKEIDRVEKESLAVKALEMKVNYSIYNVGLNL